MNSLNKKNVLLILLFIFLVPSYICAEEEPAQIEIEGNNAKVTLVQGTVERLEKGKKIKAPLYQGDTVSEGDHINTGKKSKLEIRLPDGSYIRFHEGSIFELISVGGKKEWKINVQMMLGRIWAYVSKYSGRRYFDITTKKAIAGVRGTVYRMNVNEDDAVSVKVYSGEVTVKRRKETESKTNQLEKIASPTPARDRTTPISGPIAVTGGPTPITGPQTVANGPTPISGPTPVSMEEWTYILKSMQQIKIHADGTATPPFPFDTASDANDWVRWNQKRDHEVMNIKP